MSRVVARCLGSVWLGGIVSVSSRRILVFCVFLLGFGLFGGMVSRRLGLGR